MSTIAEQPCYTLINIPTDTEPLNELQLKLDLEKGDAQTKIEALKKTIHMILSGERLPGLLMTIIRFVLPLQDHTIKKLLLIFWEIVPKTSPDGKLLQEMILVCDAYRKDLQHPNEFVRGSTLRFLCKLKEPELLEPLMPAIITCLEHRHSYVRRNAVLAIFTIYRNFEFLIPDAPELIAKYLEGEQDMSCRRNAFLMLLHADQNRALAYLAACLDQVPSFGDILQLVIVELIYKVCLANPSERARFIRCIYSLLNSPSAAVRYEAAGTLVTLSNAPTAIKAAASCYIELVVKESDNNVKLIVLDRLIAMKESPVYERVLQDLVMDVLRVLGSPALEVRTKTLALAMDLVTTRTIEEMVQLLKKEVLRTVGGEHEDAGRYRQLLVRTLHACSIKFSDVAATLIPVLTDFLSENNEAAATDVLVFVREAIQRFENLRPLIVQKLLEVFPHIRSVKVHRAALWILGEYATTKEDIEAFMSRIRAALGELPLLEAENRHQAGEKTEDGNTQATPAQLVTSDGTYATQSAFSTASTSTYLLKYFRTINKSISIFKLFYPAKEEEKRPALVQYMMEGDFFIGASLGTTLAKLALRYKGLESDEQKRNHMQAESMLIMTSVLQLGRSGLPAKAMTHDDAERLFLCLRSLACPTPLVQKVFTEGCRDALGRMLTAKAEEDSQTQKAKEKPGSIVQVDDAIQFLQLSRGSDLTGGAADMFEQSLSAAVAGRPGSGADAPAPSALSKVTQLTGFSDPVYAEALVHVNQYDIVLDVLIVNQTEDTLQNCTLELATMGDLKLVERPQPIVLAPRDFASIKANVKVASTENGIIFGNIVYDVSGAGSDRSVVVLNDIHIDIMDYIVPATCTDAEFRQMWAEFEWENKVSVNTTLSDLREYLAHLLKSTNMRCLTPEKALSGQCGFMAANMYAKSIFGEDALANMSIEKPLNKPDAPVVGHIRIRAKSQGMALSLGDKINSTQKGPQSKVVQAA
nr:coatomer subunit beta-like isoform X1 [Megalopta genalis]